MLDGEAAIVGDAVGQHGQKRCHAYQIFTVVQCEQIETVICVAVKVSEINLDEFAAAVAVLAVETEKCLNGFLLEVWGVQYATVWLELFVYVEHSHLFYRVGQLVHVAFFLQIRNVKAESVIADKQPVAAYKFHKCDQNVLLCITAV